MTEVEPMPFPFENIRSESEWLREQIQEVKSAALLAYGALLAHNTDGKYDLVLAAMRGPLFPGDKQNGSPSR